MILAFEGMEISETLKPEENNQCCNKSQVYFHRKTESKGFHNAENPVDYPIFLSNIFVGQHMLEINNKDTAETSMALWLTLNLYFTPVEVITGM